MTRPTVAGAPVTERPWWWTGTIEDAFTPIYLAMGRATDRHGAFPPDVVDRMDLTTVAAFMGVGVEEARQRRAHESMKASGVEVVMVPKSRSGATDAGGVILPG